MRLGRYFRMLVLILLTVGMALAVSGCGGQASSSGAAAVVAEGSEGSREGTSDGATAPDFELTTVEGQPLRLAETTGQVRLIDFWATWCAPCKEEIPMLNELQATYGDRGFRILAISEEDADLIREFVEDHDVAYTNLVGTPEVAEAYGVLGLPAAYLLDGEGRVVKSFLGPKPKKVLVEKIEALLQDGPAT